MKNRILSFVSFYHALNDAAVVAVPTIFPLLYDQKFIIEKYFYIGILSYIGLLVSVISQMIVGQIAEKFEYRHLLFISLCSLSLTMFLITRATIFLIFLFIYIWLRISSSFYHPLGVAWISDVFKGKSLDQAMGIQSGSGNLGVFLAFISTGYLAQKYNWKIPLIFWGIIGIMIAFLGLRLSQGSTSRGQEIVRINLSSWIKTFKQIKVFIIGLLFGGASWGTTIFYAPSFLHHKLNISMGRTGLYLAGWIGAGTMVTYSYGKINQLIGRFRTLILGFAGTCIFSLLIGLIFQPLINLFCS
ncbi:MAG: MFS transporter [Candidatus Aminicenantia bacterium]